jgi:Zn-dependent protease
MLGLFIRINFGLAIFNLIPIAPLDGSKIVTAFLSDAWAARFESALFRAGIFPLLLLVGFEAVNPGSGPISLWFRFWKPLVAPILALFRVPAFLYPG